MTADLRLVTVDGRLELHEFPRTPRSRGVFVDFTELARRPASKKHPLSRAIGSGSRTVVDATAGLGQDAFLMAAIGHDVTAMERNSVVAELLADGVARALECEEIAPRIGQRLRVVAGDARELLTSETAPEVVYIDPMYPPKRKSSALAKKSIRWVRELVGEDPDADELFEVARRVATVRVVVKRPHHAPHLVVRPDVQYEGKLVRYDVYTRASLPS